MSEEIVERDLEKSVEEFVEENNLKLEKFLHVNLQVLCQRCVDQGFDIFTTLGYVEALTKLYKTNFTKEFKKMCKNRKKWEKENKISE